MPKRVQLPDGSIGEFPDNMDDSAIEDVLRKQFGSPQSGRPAGLPAGVELPGVPQVSLPSRLTATAAPGFLDPHEGDSKLATIARGGAAGLVGMAGGFPSLAATPPPMVLGKSGEMATNAYIRGVKEQSKAIDEAGESAMEHPLYTASSIAVPLAVGYGLNKGIKAIPTKAKAGAIFQDVMKDAGGQPVNLSRSGDKLLRIDQLAQRGGSMPSVTGKLLDRISDASRPPMTYAEARDFASNLSDLAANEKMGMNRQMRGNVRQMSNLFNQDVGDAAAAVGRLKDYNDAMKMYSRAARIGDAAQFVGDQAAKPLIKAAGLGAAGTIGYKLAKR